MKFIKSTLIATLLLTSSVSVFGAETTREFERRFPHTKSLSHQDMANSYWKDWVDTKTKRQDMPLVQYVFGISKSNPDASLWFLLTGGKYGFENRKATMEEATLMYNSLSNIVDSGTIDDGFNMIQYRRNFGLDTSPLRFEYEHVNIVSKIICAKLSFAKENVPFRKPEREESVLSEETLDIATSINIAGHEEEIKSIRFIRHHKIDRLKEKIEMLEKNSKEWESYRTKPEMYGHVPFIEGSVQKNELEIKDLLRQIKEQKVKASEKEKQYQREIEKILNDDKKLKEQVEINKKIEIEKEDRLRQDTLIRKEKDRIRLLKEINDIENMIALQEKQQLLEIQQNRDLIAQYQGKIAIEQERVTKGADPKYLHGYQLELKKWVAWIPARQKEHIAAKDLLIKTINNKKEEMN